ncbi:hypothetical protein GCM10007170_40700 [Arthrobacter liuii]|uniref:Uncharacterized protein n=1 Tax=Arthrobacter liuii TaxID=1476996 RepID=A0ABQ2AXQ0_9MICC|nr:hypothetical protein GCM10007170_40700 [Arthrobacter liuii]
MQPVIDTLASFLRPFTAELLAEGSAGAVIDAGNNSSVPRRLLDRAVGKASTPMAPLRR